MCQAATCELAICMGCRCCPNKIKRNVLCYWDGICRYRARKLSYMVKVRALVNKGASTRKMAAGLNAQVHKKTQISILQTAKEFIRFCSQ